MASKLQALKLAKAFAPAYSRFTDWAMENLSSEDASRLIEVIGNYTQTDRSEEAQNAFKQVREEARALGYGKECALCGKQREPVNAVNSCSC